MLKSVVSGVALLALTTAAGAQDFNSPGSGPSFAGAEVGGVVGAAVGGGGVSATGVSGGGYAGYNLQNGPIVGGVEADVLGSTASGSGKGGTLSQNLAASARARAGYAFGNILAYGTIGPAWGSSNFTRNGYNTDKSLQGYTFGVGGEIAVTRTISARAELRHYEFGSPTYYTPSGSQKIDNSNNLLLVGVGARF